MESFANNTTSELWCLCVLLASSSLLFLERQTRREKEGKVMYFIVATE